LPSYIKDVYHYKQNAVQTVINKFSPLNSILYQMWMNKDYFGTQIANEGDPAWQRWAERLGFVAKSYEPFSIRNMQREAKGDIQSRIEPFLGITPAPYDVNMTPTEKRAREMEMKKTEIGGRTKEQSQAAQGRAKVLQAYKKAGKDNKETVLDEAVKSHMISENEKKLIRTTAGMTPLERYTRTLSVSELAALAKKSYTTPYEREQLGGDAVIAVDNALKKIVNPKISDDEKQKFDRYALSELDKRDAKLQGMADSPQKEKMLKRLMTIRAHYQKTAGPYLGRSLDKDQVDVKDKIRQLSELDPKDTGREKIKEEIRKSILDRAQKVAAMPQGEEKLVAGKQVKSLRAMFGKGIKGVFQDDRAEEEQTKTKQNKRNTYSAKDEL
jgi:hypothetical protein